MLITILLYLNVRSVWNSHVYILSLFLLETAEATNEGVTAAVESTNKIGDGPDQPDGEQKSAHNLCIWELGVNANSTRLNQWFK